MHYIQLIIFIDHPNMHCKNVGLMFLIQCPQTAILSAFQGCTPLETLASCNSNDEEPYKIKSRRQSQPTAFSEQQQQHEHTERVKGGKKVQPAGQTSLTVITRAEQRASESRCHALHIYHPSSLPSQLVLWFVVILKINM